MHYPVCGIQLQQQKKDEDGYIFKTLLSILLGVNLDVGMAVIPFSTVASMFTPPQGCTQDTDMAFFLEVELTASQGLG
jgi:hypothetical protein